MEVLSNIEQAFKAPEEVKQHFTQFVQNHPETFNSRSNDIGHITCSMLVLNETRDKVLLTHHKKFGMWLQLGGHWDDGKETALQTALRETSEEGYGENRIVCDVFLNGQPFDLDAHEVNDPIGNHIHFDICFMGIVKDEFPVNVSHESHDVKWFSIKDIIDTEMVNSRLNRLLKKSSKVQGETIAYEVIL